MAFLDVQASEMATNRVVELLAKELKWGWRRRRAETKKTKEFLKSLQGKIAPSVKFFFNVPESTLV